MAAVGYTNNDAVNTLLSVRATRGLDLERGLFANSATPLSVVSVASSPPVCVHFLSMCSDITQCFT